MFIHIPKTGGHSVWDAMKQHGGYALKDVYGPGNGFSYHETADDLRLKFGHSMWKGFKKISVVRNPWERAVGLYFGEKRKGNYNPKGFKKWLWKYHHARQNELDKRFNPLFPQTRLLRQDVHVWDLKQIDLLFRWMEKRQEIKIENPGMVQSGHHRENRLHWTKFHTKRTREIIGRANEQDIRRFRWTYN